MRIHVPRKVTLVAALCWLATTVTLLDEPAVPDRHDERERAFALLASGEASEAAEAFAALVERDPGDLRAIEGRVRALLRLQRWREALAEARAHAARRDDAPRLQAALGQALFRAGRLEEIESTLAPLAEREEAPGRALALLGRLREAEGRKAEAVELMTRAVAAAPADRDVLYWASGATATRSEAVRRLERYLERSEGDAAERIDAAEGWLGLMEMLGERAVWIPGARPARIDLPLQRIWDPATGTTQGFVIRAAIGDKGKPVRLLLDSGSPGLFVIRRMARRRGFAPLAEQSAFGGGGSGRHTTTRGLFSRVSIGGLEFRDALATVNKQELDPTGRYHGLIGLSVFHGYRVTLDLDGDRLLLEPTGDAAEGDPYWIVSGQLLVRAGLNGPDPGLFLFDTGATHTLVDMTLAGEVEGARMGSAVALQGFGGLLPGARRLEGVVVEFQDLWSERVSPRTVDLSTRSRASGIEISGFLGLDLLEGRQVVVDTTRRRIVVR